MVVPIKFIEDHHKKSVHKGHSWSIVSKFNGSNNETADVEEAIPIDISVKENDDSKNVTALKVADGDCKSSQSLRRSSRSIRKERKLLNRQTRESVSFTPGSNANSNCILLPHGEARSYWDLYISILLIYVGTFVPYRVSFMGDLEGIMAGVELFVDVSFGFDIIFNFFTGYETRDGHVEIRYKKIAKQYLRTYFVLDLIATIPVDRVLEVFFDDWSTNGVNKAGKLTRLPRLIKILRIAKLLKVLRLYRFKKWIREIQLNYSIHYGITRLLNIVVIVLFATHLVACIWHGIGVKLDVEEAQECEGDVAEGWVCREDMSDQPKGHTYVAALYWSFSTLTTVGYGDIAGRTVEEQIFSMLMMLLGVSWYAYTVGSMSTILASFDKQSKQMREKMIEVNTFVRETRLSAPLGNRVRRYFEYSLSRKQNGLFGYDADVILQELSTALRTEVLCVVEAELIECIPFFEGKSRTFVANTILLLRPVIVQKGEYIIKEGSASDEMYFLIKGAAAVYYGDSEVKRLNRGAYFGEIGCILGGVRKASIVASSVCELRCLSRQNLNQLLGQHPSVGEDLKKVARARMKVVKSTPHPMLHGRKSVTKSSTSSSLSMTEAKNLAKLEKVDFHNLDNATDEFTELRIHLEGMNRKLSLTSGVLAKGNHIKAEKEVLEKMNFNTNDQRSEDDGEEDNRSLNEKISQENDEEKKVPSRSEKEESSIEKESNNNERKDDDTRELQRILSLLSQREREVIYNFMLSSITHHTKRKVKENCLILLDCCQGEFIQRRS